MLTGSPGTPLFNGRGSASCRRSSDCGRVVGSPTAAGGWRWRRFAAALWQLGVDFYIGGSVASTYHGAIRSTMDVDLICTLQSDQVAAFVAAFGPESYVSEAIVHCS